MKALEVRGLSHSFGRDVALDDVSLSVPAGAVTTLLGMNGAGKTTLFNLVTRLYAARTGRIAICGHDIATANRLALAAMGIVFQTRALDANLTLLQNLRYAAALHGIGRGQATARAREMMERLGIAGLAARPIRQLSGGQAQRGEIARALMHRPRLLMCDEATAGLDIEARHALVEEVHRLASDEGVGVLWATHLTDEIWPDDQVIVLHHGRVLADDRASTLAGKAGIDAAFLRLIRAEGVAA